MKQFFGRPRKRPSSPVPVDEAQTVRRVDLASVLDIAIEVWRLQDRFTKLQLATGRQDPGITFSIEKIQHVLREIGIEARDYTGQAYNEGMSLDVLTFDYPAEARPINRVVQETVSPAIFFDGKLHKMAQVIVGKAGDGHDDTKYD